MTSQSATESQEVNCRRADEVSAEDAGRPTRTAGRDPKPWAFDDVAANVEKALSQG